MNKHCDMTTLRRILVLSLSLSAVAYAQNSAPTGTLSTNPVYEKNCAKCHGKTAEGRFMAGPSLVSSKTTGMSSEDLRAIIANGKHRMPRFEGKLSSDEIDALVSQIKAAKK